MADQNTSIVTADNLLAIYLEKRALVTLQNDVVMDKLIAPENRYTIPAGMGVQTTWNAWPRLAAASSTLAEASSNSAVNLSARKVNVTIASYGKLNCRFEGKPSPKNLVNSGKAKALANAMLILSEALFKGNVQRLSRKGVGC